MRTSVRLLVVVLLAWSAVVPATDRPLLILNDAHDPPYTTEKRDGFLDKIAIEIFRRLDYDVRLVKLPPERGLLDANAGVEDGDLARIGGIEKLYPNLLRVDEVIVTEDFSAFGRNSRIPARWEEIRKHTVGYIRGWKIYEKAMAGAPNVTSTETPEQLFRLLSLGRIDIALYEHALGTALIRKLNLRGIQPLSPPLARKDMYMYLHRKHAVLVPRVAETLRLLKREGFYGRVYNQKLKPYRNLSGS